ncbi:MAG: hypothetical protein HFI00_12080 [Lachnospiraceae bacterium]|nr:hypothetical protein [Lachnospiraceae bacterium]
METLCVYQGGIAGDLKEYHILNENRFSVFFLGGIWKPKVDIGRSKISGLPLKSLIAINGIFEKYQMTDRDTGFGLREWRAVPLKEWREARTSLIDKWMEENLSNLNYGTKQGEQNTGTGLMPIIGGVTIYTQYIYGRSPIIDKYLAAYFQDKYKMTINYEGGQVGDGNFHRRSMSHGLNWNKQIPVAKPEKALFYPHLLPQDDKEMLYLMCEDGEVHYFVKIPYEAFL